VAGESDARVGRHRRGWTVHRASRPNRGRCLVAVVAALLVWSAFVSGSATASSTSQSKKSKLTVLCTVEERWCAAQTGAFQRQTGITTSFVRLSGGDALAAVTGATGSPQYSVWWGGSADGYEAAKAAGKLQPYKSPNAATIPKSRKDPQGSWTGIYIGALGFCSNRTKLAELGVSVPRSWSDLLDPALKGQVSIAHPASSGTAYTALWTLMTLNHLDADATFKYLTALNQNVPAYTTSGTAPIQEVAQGSAAVAVVFAHDCVAAISDGAHDLVLSFPKEGTGSEIGATAVLKGAPDPAAARRWVDWALTAKAQEIGPTVRAFQLPVNPKAKVSKLSVDLNKIKLVKYDFVQAGKMRTALTDRFAASIAPVPPEEPGS
jgi:iron(III) transport system substrate-binding protein